MAMMDYQTDGGFFNEQNGSYLIIVIILIALGIRLFS